MELFGVTPHIERICQRLAAQGYWALAPDFFHRSGPRQSLPYDADGRARGFACLDRLNQRAVLDDVAAALRYVRAQPECSGRVGAAGFSIGGHIAFLAAAQADIAACACFYAGWLDDAEFALSRGGVPALTLAPDIAARGTPLQYFVGEQDALVGAPQRAAIARALERAGV